MLIARLPGSQRWRARPGVLGLMTLLGWSLFAYSQYQLQEHSRDAAHSRGQLQAQLSAAELERQELARQIEDVRQQLAERRALSRSLMAARLELASTEQQLHAEREALAERQTELSNSGQLLAALRSETLTTKDALLKARGSLNRRLQTTIAEAQTELQAVLTALQTKKAEAASLDRKLAELALRREQLAAVAALPPPAPTAAPARATPAEVAELPGEARPSGDRAGLYRLGALSVPSDAELAQAAGGEATPAASDLAGLAATPAAGTASPPASWAEAQYRLGVSLASAGEQDSGSRKLEDAVLAFRAALGEWTAETAPRQRPRALTDLGHSLALLGRRKNDPQLLREAIASSQEALGTLNPRRDALRWAVAQHSLGVAFEGLARLRRGIADHNAAITAYTEARDAFQTAGAEAQAAETERRLAEAKTLRLDPPPVPVRAGAS